MYITQHYEVATARCTMVQSAVFRLHVVRPSVTLVGQDNIGWKYWKLIATDNKPNIFALRSPKAIHLLPGEHGEIWGRLEVWSEKVACWSTKKRQYLRNV